MKVVLDTNVFVAGAFKPGSASGKILEMVRSGDLEMVWHKLTKDETEFIVKKIPPTRWKWNEYIDLFLDQYEVNDRLQEDALQFIEDPDDRKFFALANQTEAVLITNDEHLLVHRKDVQIEITTTAEFLREI